METSSLSGDIVVLNSQILKSSVIPAKLNRLRGDIFEKWLNVRGTTPGAYSQNPMFTKKDYPGIRNSTRLLADGFTGTLLLEAKAIQSKRGPQGKEITQMKDYKYVLSSGANWQDSSKTIHTFNKVRYVINDAPTKDLWFGAGSHGQSHLGGFAEATTA
jgi:hypothetical protein